jgi:hypothetical protein
MRASFFDANHPPYNFLMSQLDELKQHSLVVADTGDIEQVARWKPQDATTNPSLLLTAAEDPRYQHLVQSSVREARGDTSLAMDWMFVLFGKEILNHVRGRVSTEVDARLSFDQEKSLRKARSLIALYEKVGVSRELDQDRREAREGRHPLQHDAALLLRPGRGLRRRRRDAHLAFRRPHLRLAQGGAQGR